ncbi:glycosyltransferase family 2 protein [Paractinoplanes globisporus]|uniref:Glycosyltransferase family 2 protein n=1 Tax=Paractinoplanes globisporus TaxID=113565 RepID=A0ABW6W6X6_9ACTN|nr:glycosyltransferase family 2 protein [Actinoplanes globisporus]
MKDWTLLTAPELDPTGGELPAVVLDVDLAEPLPPVAAVHPDGRRVRRAWVLARLFTEPIGAALIDVPDGGLRPAGLGAALAPAIGQHFGGLPVPIDGYTPATEPAFLARRRAVLDAAPHITAVVCTRERPGALARCLDSLIAQRYPAFRVLVVDNAPITGAAAEVTRAAARRGPVDYLREERLGRSFARNTAVRQLPGEILAWIDEDAVADPHWLAEIACALAGDPAADAVCGLSVPAELESQTQLWYERLTGARSFSRSPVTKPFTEITPVAFRAGVIERVGMFDTALGAGTPAGSGEDVLALARVLVGGGRAVHQPSALSWRHYPSDLDGLRRRITSDAKGVAGAYMRMVFERPTLLGKAMRHAMRVPVADGIPREVLRAGRRGMVAGPGAYLRGRRVAKARDR